MRWLFVLGLLSLGCDDPLAYPQDIERLRVLGARASVEGDSTRAWPGPGEQLSLEWLVAAPDPSPSVGFYLEACPSRASARGTPECTGAPIASAQAAGMPLIDFVTPDVPRVLVQGLVCRDAVPSSLGASCPDESERVLFDVVVGGENRNPTLGDAGFLIDGASWPVPTAAELASASCAPGDPTLSVASGEKVALELRLDPSDRDALDDPSGLAPPFEPLLVSGFATNGRLSRPLSVVEGASDEFSARLSWRAPEDAAGERTRFYFVARDGRGGVDWSARTLCLVP